MFHNITLIGKKNEELLHVKHKISKNRLYRINLLTNVEDAIRFYNPEFNVELFVVNFSELDGDKIENVRALFHLTQGVPVLVLSHKARENYLGSLNGVGKSVILEKPFVDKDLWGVISKLINGKNVSQRFHRRFKTDQDAELEEFSNGFVINGKLCNLSRGGAYLVHQGGKFNVGDLLRLKVNLNQVSKYYKVDAKVVWSSEGRMTDNKSSMGVEFLKSGDVYRNLLSKL